MPTYKAVFRSDELYHFNKNHDHLGRFDTGDGDGDGIIDESKFSSKEKANLKKTRQSLGSKSTQNAFDRMAASKTYSEITKNLSDFDKSARRDIKEAQRLGDDKAANLINSGRMYYIAMVDGSYQQKILNKALAEISKTETLTLGMDFTFNMLRDPDFGGLKVEIDNGRYTTQIKE